jgi:D-alanine transaminase
MPVCDTVFLNGGFIPVEEAKVSPFDRAFLFAHAAYEVTAVYGGEPIDMDGHLTRLQRTLNGIAIPGVYRGEMLAQIHRELIERNDLNEGLIYLQITAGAYGERDFAGPETLAPSLFLYADRRTLIGEAARVGIRAMFMQDTRWLRRDMKTTQLLSQALAYRAARQNGAKTALMVEDGMVTEAASANVWIVDEDGRLITRELSQAILPGITRAAVMKHLVGEGVEVHERAFSPDEAYGAREVFTTSAGAMIAPIVAIDGHAIGNGAPGPVTRAVQRMYYAAMGVDLDTVAPWTKS